MGATPIAGEPGLDIPMLKSVIPKIFVEESRTSDLPHATESSN